MDPLTVFSEATREWFNRTFDGPTPAQQQGWPVIASGVNTLIQAPTGSGKTLAAFLYAIDRLTPTPGAGLRVLYVSPLKALNYDVERNLRGPLAGLQSQLRVAVRTGDTPQKERAAMLRSAPDILITTPESLFLMLTSRARELLRTVDTVIVDEVHAVAGTKRGAHLALSLERLQRLVGDRPLQRIGLSATQRPLEEIGRFVGGGRPIELVNAGIAKQLDLQVVVPIEDMRELASTGQLMHPVPVDGQEMDVGTERSSNSIWPSIYPALLALVREHRSTIVFVNNRRLAERLALRLNELAEEEVARAHHGSLAREQRVVIEEDLKAGRIPCLVATSSLELGIDMGAVDLVVQVESPKSVARGLQRIGRAGHTVDAVSKGRIFPKFRADLLESAVVAQRMRAGAIEETQIPRNPLDVLAQQIVAMVALDTCTVDEVEDLIRRAAPFAGLPRSALEAVLDMLAGRYPSDAFAELRPRLIWDRVTGELTARAGAQRLAVTSGGTIPDRGLFGVFLATAQGPARRVGELDEEMVYESRVGDVFLLGSSSWRIEDITHDRVLVTPAPGEPGRMPFWKGDSPGRPVELGRALGAFLREIATATPDAAAARARAAGLDEWGTANLLAYLDEQREVTRHLPDDRTVLVERFRDELGDWRLVVHSPFGAPVNAPWALAIGARLRERYGLDVTSMHSDDGIVLRLPDTDADPVGSDVVLFEPDEIEAIVTAEVGGSALFAARFRECASRALLLPKRDPRRRAPLWQQRQRANQLLQVARDYGEFPIVLEAMRECLQDVFDVPGLVGLMRQLASRQVKLVEVETAAASPFARSLLFGYVGTFVYEGDAPLAERRAQALSLDSAMLAELLGATELRELLDNDAIELVEAELARLAEERHAHGPDSVHDLLRTVGDLSTAEAIVRGATPRDLETLEASRRAIRVRIAGDERWIAIEDAGRVRDALGTALPVGVPETFTEPVRDPLRDLVSRYGRTHGPFHAQDVAARLGLGVAVVGAALARLSVAGQVVQGEFRPGGMGTEWCDAEVLRTIRRRSLAALRREVEPVPIDALARFIPAWQAVGARSSRGVDGVLRVVEQLAGVPLPASALETLVLPSRVVDYAPAMLDELTLAGEVLWVGCGALARNDGWLVLAPSDIAPLVLPPVDAVDGELATAITGALSGDQAVFFRALADRVDPAATDESVVAAIWELVWAGALTNDTLAPVRALLGTATRTAHSRRPRAPRARYGRYAGIGAGLTPAATSPARSAPFAMAGRWSAAPVRDLDPTRRAVAAADGALDRYGLVTRGSISNERVVGGFAAVYRVLKVAEESGRARRGYFVDGLGAAQFALPGAVDGLRSQARPVDLRGAGPTLVLAATDPANPYGAALPWPTAPSVQPGRRGHQPTRKAGALVVLVDGQCVIYVERGGRTLLSFTDEIALLQPAADALALAVRDGALGKLQIERADGAPVVASALGAALESAGFRPTPRGLRLRA